MSLKLLRNVLALTLLLVATAYAQGRPGSGQRPQGPPSPVMQLERLVKVMANASVPLSDTQQTTILSVYQDGETAAKGDSSTSSFDDQAARREQMQALEAGVRKAVRAQLSDEQAKVFDTMRQPGPPGQTGGSGGPPSGGTNDGPPSQ